MKLKQYLEENALDISAAEKKANDLVRKKNIIRDKIRKLRSQPGNHEDEIARLQKELQDIQHQHNKLSVQ